MSSNSVLQYNTPSFAIHLISLAIHLHFPCNTISSTTHSSCNTIRILQYNFFSATAHFCNTILPYCNTLTQPTCKPHCNTIPCIAIQFFSPTSLVAIQILVLQYNYLAHKPPLAIQFSKPTTLPRLQYNALACNKMPPTTPFSCNTIVIQFFFPALSLTIQLQGCNTKKKKKKFTRQLGSSPIPVCLFFHIIFFFISSSYWKTLKIHV